MKTLKSYIVEKSSIKVTLDPDSWPITLSLEDYVNMKENELRNELEQETDDQSVIDFYVEFIKFIQDNDIELTKRRCRNLDPNDPAGSLIDNKIMFKFEYGAGGFILNADGDDEMNLVGVCQTSLSAKQKSELESFIEEFNNNYSIHIAKTFKLNK